MDNSYLLKYSYYVRSSIIRTFEKLVLERERHRSASEHTNQYKENVQREALQKVLA